MRTSFLFSAGLHVAMLLLATLGLPFTLREPPPLPEPVILVELDAPIAAKTNAPPAPPAPPRPEPPKPEPPKPEPVKEPDPPKPQPKPEPPKPVEAPKPPDPPKQVAEPLPKPDPKPEPKPEPKQAEALPPPEPKQKPKAKPQEPAFDPTKLAALLDRKPTAPKDTSAPPPSQAQTTPQQTARAAPNSPFDPNQAVTQSERDYVVRQIEANWNLDCGKRDAHQIVVKVSAFYNPDGTLKGEPKIVDRASLLLPGRESWLAAAESARRAVLRTQPLKFPPGDAARWQQEIVMNFDGRATCGG